jgi:ABC-2 type transport system permease protein
MRTTWYIAWRELRAYFSSPVAYIVIAGFCFLSGFLFFNGFFVQRVARLDGFFNTLPLIYLFFGPAVAMRLLAEERGTGTMEMLLTLPVRDREVVIGKYLAAIGLLTVFLLATTPFAVTVGKLGELDPGPVVGGYLGGFLLGGLYLAAGLLASALARNQVVAFVAGLILCFGLFMLQRLVEHSGSATAALLYMSPQLHVHNLTRGFVELRTLVYFVSTIGVFLLLSTQALEARKWR